LKVATAERQHAEAIIYSISDGVLVTDPFDELVLANESAARTFDFELSNADRSPVDRVLHDPKMIELIKEMRQSNSRTGRRIVEHQVRTPLGERVYKITLSCVADSAGSDPVLRDGKPLPSRGEHGAGVVAVLHDMTREKEVAEMKNDFVSNVSHELRTPLASIKAYVEMLIDGEAEDDRTRREFYEVIQNESNRLSRLIDNILNISRIESGLVKITKQPQSMSVILKDAIDVISPPGARQINHHCRKADPALLSDHRRQGHAVSGRAQSARQRHQIHPGKWHDNCGKHRGRSQKNGQHPNYRHRGGDSAQGPPLCVR